MISEVAVTAAKVSAEVAKETAKETVSEIGKAAANKCVDIGKRIDITKSVGPGGLKGIDITKRIVPESIPEISIKDIATSAKQYLSDLKAKSAYGDTIFDKLLDISKLEIRPQEQVENLREEFDKNKAKIIKEWEVLNNRVWPKYTQDIFNDKGIPIRKVGDNYDAHHINPLKLGGENVASNITPMDLFKHRDIHSGIGSCTKLLKAVEGAVKL
ncbi:HNH endonuclease signature motif containing protein [Ruminococcus flavefaciens]|uniref:HNH endonuclease signature motif containing protein n=1 Tax=Ruminococcus flavefaciens TaxID=1265 RepID=UPI0002DC303C|nr:HNH endonuclease signature motif containing protein [Ruminococcus flavefaciens]